MVRSRSSSTAKSTISGSCPPQAAGHKFKTACDTEVIVHAWEQWGESCVKRFRGMFVFALYDKNKQAVRCATCSQNRFV